MTEYKFGDKITWTEGSQMDRVTHNGVVVKVKTIVEVVDEYGHKKEVDFDSLKKGWKKNVK